LIIGGSRGLGEVFAKVLALCGAEVLLTYHQGEQDAKAIVADILSNNGKADCLYYDVTSSQIGRVAAFAPTTLYYMATPFIGKGQRSSFNSSAFVRYCNYYVNGFAAVFAGVRHEGLGAVYYPSSVFLDERPVDMSEYIAAKSAGEALCATLAKTYPAIRFSCPRLPRIATDQSASLVPTSNKLVLPLVLAQLEHFVMEMK
jgi:NAD(P)-dependent dehydrogenase (short-subunit alcohol dehydrogenase family)